MKSMTAIKQPEKTGLSGTLVLEPAVIRNRIGGLISELVKRCSDCSSKPCLSGYVCGRRESSLDKIMGMFGQ